MQLLDELGVDVQFLMDQSDSFFPENVMGEHTHETFTFEELMNITLELRGSTYPQCACGRLWWPPSCPQMSQKVCRSEPPRR